MSFVAIDRATGEVLRINVVEDHDGHRPREVIATGVGVGRSVAEVEAALAKMFGHESWWKGRFEIVERAFVPPPTVDFEEDARAKA